MTLFKLLSHLNCHIVLYSILHPTQSSIHPYNLFNLSAFVKDFDVLHIHMSKTLRCYNNCNTVTYSHVKDFDVTLSHIHRLNKLASLSARQPHRCSNLLELNFDPTEKSSSPSRQTPPPCLPCSGKSQTKDKLAKTWQRAGDH